MNFFWPQVSFDEIGRLEPYLLCDALELRLLYNEYSEISDADFDDLLRDASIYDEKTIASNHWVRAHLSATDDEEIEGVFRRHCWEILRERSAWFEGYYPFEVRGKYITLAFPITQEKLLYCFLLLCSKLRHLQNPGHVNLMAQKFEELCGKALGAAFPNCEFVNFGPGSPDRARFGNNLREGVAKLAEWLGETARPQELSELSQSGDYGIDVVGLLQQDPASPGSIILFAQCAAREDEWQKKKYETQQILSVLDIFGSAPISSLFIPLCYREMGAHWFTNKDARQTALFDRLRIIKCFEKSAVQIGNILPAFPMNLMSDPTHLAAP